MQSSNISIPGDIIVNTNGTNRIDDIIIRGTLIPDPIAGTASADQTICSGDTPAPLTLAGSDGDIQWQWSLNGSTGWTDIGGATDATLSGAQMGALTATRYYRAAVSIGAATVYSNSVQLTVNPIVTVAVSISANPPGSVCAGTEITYTASTSTPGTKTYQWHVNGNPQGSNSATFQYAPANGDEVYVVMTTDAACPDLPQAESNRITATVNDVIPASVTIEPSANPVCQGSSVTFTATPVNGGTPVFQWVRNGSIVGGVSGSVYTYTPSQTGDLVFVNMTSSLACTEVASSQPITMEVTPKAIPAFSIDNQWCEGDSPPNLPNTSNNNVSGYWEPDIINDGPFPHRQEPYVFTFTPDPGQCSEGFTTQITVQERIDPEFSLGPFCQQTGSYTLPSSSVNGVTGSWNLPQISLANTDSYDLVFNPSGGQCAASYTTTIEVREVRQTVFDNILPLCQGDLAPTLPASDLNGITGSWLPATISTAAANTTPYVFTPAPEELCALPYSIEVVVNALPEIQCIGDFAVCADAEPFTLSGIEPSGGVYSVGGIPLTLFNPQTAGTGPHEILYVYEDANNCVADCSFSIQVNPLPQVIATGPPEIDFMTSAQLTGEAPGIVNPVFLWSPAELLQTADNVPNPVTVPLNESHYFTLKVTDDNNCSSTEQIRVNVVGGELAVDIEASDTDLVICAGEEITLTALASGGTLSYTFTWSSTQGSITSTADEIIVAPTVTTIYTVEVFDGQSTESANIQITVNPLPANSFIPAYSTCLGAPVNEFSPGLDFYYLIDGVRADDFNAVLTEARLYEATRVRTNIVTGCVSYRDFAINVKPVPVISAGGNVEVPYGNVVTLDGATSVPESGVTYRWTPADTFVNGQVLHPVTQPVTATTEATFEVTLDGCPATDRMTIIVLGSPMEAEPYAFPTQICAGESVQLFANASGGHGELSYHWTSSAGHESSEEDPVFTVVESTTFFLTVQSETPSITRSLVVDIFSLPVLTCPSTPYLISLAVPSHTLSAVAPPGGTYFYNGDPVVNSVIVPSELGLGQHGFTYEYTSAQGCFSTCSFTVEVTEIPLYSLAASTNPTGTGSITGAGEYAEGDAVTLTATVPAGWTFSHWTGSSEDLALLDDPTAASNAFNMPARGVNLTAVFARIEHQVEIIIHGSGSVRVDGNTVVVAPGITMTKYDDASLTLEIAPPPGGGLTDLVVNGTSVGNSNLSVALTVDQNLYIEISFFSPAYVLEYNASEGGEVVGNTYQEVTDGDDGSPVTAVADAGYYFVEWSDDITDNPRTDLHVTADITVTAIFARFSYDLIYTAGEGGSIQGDATQQVFHGDDGSAVEAIPDPDYEFLVWSDGRIDNPRTDVNVTADLAVTANFERIPLGGHLLTLNLDMGPMIDMGYYHAGRDQVFVTGSMFDYAEPGSRPTEQRLQNGAEPGFLATTVRLQPGRYYYKYFLNEGWAGEEWPGAPLRSVIIDRDTVLTDIFGYSGDPTSVSVPENTGLLLYPNPAQYMLNISTTEQNPIRYVSIINLAGQTMHHRAVPAMSHVSIDVSDMPTGIYMVSVITLGGGETVKLQILRP